MQAYTSIERRAMPRHSAPLAGRVGLAGALAGLGGGLAMALVAALLTGALDQDLWLQPKVIASLVLGSPASEAAGFALGPVALGLLIHLLVAMLLGVLFARFMHRVARLPSDFGVPEVAGVAFGFLIWAAAYFVVLPVAAPGLLSIYAPALLIQHLVYGASTGLVYAWLCPRPYAQMV
jgi:hypothetical protein